MILTPEPGARRCKWGKAMSRILGGIWEWAEEESLIGKKLGLEKGAHYQLSAKSSFPLPGPASLSQAELNLITSCEYIIVFMGTGFTYIRMLHFHISTGEVLLSFYR